MSRRSGDIEGFHDGLGGPRPRSGRRAGTARQGLFATRPGLGWVGVFGAAAAALVMSSLLAAFLGSQLGSVIPTARLKLVAGVAFVLIGIWTLVDR